MKHKIKYKKENNIYFNQSPVLFAQLIELLEKYPYSYNNMLKAKGRKRDILKNPNYIPPYKELFNWINESLPLLNDSFYKLSTKCYWILNGLTQFPCCQHNGCNFIFNHINVEMNQGYPRLCIKHSKSDESVINKRVYNSRQKYGTDFPQQSAEVREKTSQTNLEKYGYTSPLACPVCQKLGKQSKLKKYGDENWSNRKQAAETYNKHRNADPMFIKNIQIKIKQTNLNNGHSGNWVNPEQAKKTRIENNGEYWTTEMLNKTVDTKNRHNLENPNYNTEIQNKIRKTVMSKYGVSSIFDIQQVKQKLKDWIIEHNGINNTFQTDYVKNKSKQTILDRYNVEHPMQSEKIKSKIDFNETNRKGNETKRRNGTFNASKPEDDSYKLLCEKFGEANIERQYRSEKYPFACDFYVKPTDTYIECNYGWTHGGHWFDRDNEKDIEKLELWKSKNTKFYDNAIRTWTERDVLKRRTAVDNNLNYEVFWNIDEFTGWISSV